MFRSTVIALSFLVGLGAFHGASHARKGAKANPGEVMTLEDAITKAERALDAGAIGDAVEISARLHRTRGLTKDEQRRLDLIDARTSLAQAAFENAEALLAKLKKDAPDDPRIGEWYGRALEGTGKGETALPLLAHLAEKGTLLEGDSYWALAQLERKAGRDAKALQHARLALDRPIVLQSMELDKEIHKFIDELAAKAK